MRVQLGKNLATTKINEPDGGAIRFKLYESNVGRVKGPIQLQQTRLNSMPCDFTRLALLLRVI
jgi:hypothetical protein